ncbi:hypothetical protein IFR05_002119 [Cadophora sp. M221]|nr:hypothetical protein IFR05_002119 [Cadophora sp. M221]
MSTTTYLYQPRGLVAPGAPSSTYRIIYPQNTAHTQSRSSTMVQWDVFGHRVQAAPLIATSAITAATVAGVPVDIASALAGWSIPSESWIYYYNGTYAWPTGLAVRDPRLSCVEQSFVPATAFLPQFTSKMVTGKARAGAGTYTYGHFASSSSNSQHQVPRASGNRADYLQDQYANVALPRPIGPPVFGGLVSPQDKMCPHSVDDQNAEKLADLRAIVYAIVPAGGLDPHVHHGPFECLKYSPGDVDENIQHFVRNGEAEYPDFSSKLAYFGCDQLGTYRGATPTDEFRREDMLELGYVYYEGEWIKEEDAEERQLEARDRAEAERNALQQRALGHVQLHPAQLEDKLAYQVEYGYDEFDDDYTQDIDSGYEDDFCLVGTAKVSVSKKGSPKVLYGCGTIRRRASLSSKAKKATKQKKLERGSKKDGHRSCLDLFLAD